ncbi:MAG: hypothetical protein ACRD38_06925 [Nitrososphaerales archaeon]
MEADRKRLDYFGIGMFAVLFVGFIVAQPLQQSYAVETEGVVETEGIPAFEDCDDQFLVDVSMDTVRSKNVILTTHSEKEIFECFTVQGNIEVLVEVTLVAQIYENTTTKDIIRKQVEVITCIRDPSQARTYGCEVDTPDTTVTPVRNCVADEIRKNQNSINKGSLVKTIEAQKMVYLCDLDGFESDEETGQPIPCETPTPNTDPECFDPEKKVDEVIFAETWKNLNNLPNDPIVKTSFESLRCVVKLDTAVVESCIFTNLGGS